MHLDHRHELLDNHVESGLQHLKKKLSLNNIQSNKNTLRGSQVNIQYYNITTPLRITATKKENFC